MNEKATAIVGRAPTAMANPQPSLSTTTQRNAGPVIAEAIAMRKLAETMRRETLEQRKRLERVLRRHKALVARLEDGATRTPTRDGSRCTSDLQGLSG